MIKRNYREWANICEANGGITINLDTEDMPLGQVTDLYSVGGATLRVVEMGNIGEDYADVLKRATVAATGKGVQWLGAWVVGVGKRTALIAEAVTLHTDRAEAMRVAEERGQDAIFNLKGAGETIFLR